MAFYLAILQPASFLSLAFQKEDIDPVRAIEALLTVKKRLHKLKSKSADEFPYLSDIKKKSTVNADGYYVYHVILKQMDQVMQWITNKKGRELTAIEDTINARLNEECTVLQPVARISNCGAWIPNDDEDEGSSSFADKEIGEVFQRFREPLQNAGVTLNEHEILDEWHDLVEYAQTYLKPEKNNYLKTWRRIFDNSRMVTDFKNILLLVEICFVMPLSNAHLERLFSRMNRIKSKTRCRLTNSRLGSLMHIGQDGKELSTTIVLPAMKLWEEEKIRRPHQKT